MSAAMVLFSVALLITAILTKIVGCGAGAKLCGYSNGESLQIGVGMISRGEVALIVASKGSAMGLLSTVYFGPTIIVVIITTIITPILLKFVFSKEKVGKYDGMIQSNLIDKYEETEQIDIVTQSISRLNEDLKKSSK